MLSQTIGQEEIVQDSQAIEEEILVALVQHGALMLDHLERILPNIESARLLFAIDRLSRAGRIAIGPPRNADYLVWAVPGESPVYVTF